MGTQPPPRKASCIGTASTEWVALATAVALLTAAIVPSLTAWGRGTAAGELAARVAKAVAGEDGAGGPTFAAANRRERPRDGVSGTTRRVEGSRVHEFGAGVGDDLRLRPIATPWAVWKESLHRSEGSQAHGARVDVKACAACAGAAVRGHATAGAAGARDRDGRHGGDGLALHGRLHAYAALAAVDATGSAGVRVGEARGRLQGRVAGAVGADVDAHGTVRAGTKVQELRLEGTAVAGATARAEARASVELVGIALQATGGAEGWAGAGATGGVHVRRERRGRVTVGARAGGALGFGGAADVTATIDASELIRHRRRVGTAGGRAGERASDWILGAVAPVSAAQMALHAVTVAKEVRE